MYYEPTTTHGAVIAQVTTNPQVRTARVVLSGFSFHYIRDDRPAFPIDRTDHLVHILQWFENLVPPPTGIGGETPIYTNSLAQNYPNPFNPETVIKFSLKSRSRVSIRVYDVAGRLVKTLVDENREPGFHADVTWNGTSERGEPVSSGVDFYKMVTGDFMKTKKMVLLK